MPAQAIQYTLVIGIGVVIGMALPSALGRLRARLNLQKKKGKCDKSDGTHAVRSFDACLHLDRQSLENFVSKILVKAGTDPSQADLVASVLAYADTRGIPSHGVNRTDTYVNEIENGVVNGRATPIIEKKTGCCAIIDGKNGLGAVTSNLAMDTAISIAKDFGVGIAVCHNSNHFGAAGYWARKALEQGMIGMSFTNTSPFAVPTGGRTRAVGTNPFCFFAPADGGDSFQLDMATTTVPVGKIEVMHRLGKPIPPGWGLDRNGGACIDGEEICRHGGLYPLGGPEETAGYKGYGLGMFVEIMCGILSNSAYGPDIGPWLATREGAIDYGHCFLVIDPSRFAPGFEERMGQYLRTMRYLPGNVKVAGDPEKEYEQNVKKMGVTLHGPVAATLKRLAERFEVSVPPELRSLDSSAAKESLYKK